MKFVLRILINALALWLTTLIVVGVKVVAFPPAGTLETVLTYLLVALVFGVVNGIVGNFIRIVAFPLYILTLGLIALIVNGFVKEVIQELPMEFAVEAQKLLGISLEGSVG